MAARRIPYRSALLAVLIASADRRRYVPAVAVLAIVAVAAHGFGALRLGQTLEGPLATVAGIVNFPIKQLDSRIVYLPLKTAQDLYVTGEQVSAWVLHGRDARSIPQLEQDARRVMGDTIRVRDWADISPELAQQINQIITVVVVRVLTAPLPWHS